MTTLEKRESQAPANSPEALALNAVRSALSRFLLTLPSLVNAIEYSMTRRVSELMQRALRQYGQFQHAYDELKENYPQIFEEPEFAAFDRDYENAIFDGGGELKAIHAVDEPIQRVDSRLPGYEQAKRKDPRFMNLMDQELAGKNPQEIQKMTEDLNKPEASQQIMQKVMHIAAPQAPAAPFCGSHLFLCRFYAQYFLTIAFPILFTYNRPINKKTFSLYIGDKILCLIHVRFFYRAMQSRKNVSWTKMPESVFSRKTG